MTFIAHRVRAAAATLLLSLACANTLAEQAPAGPVTLPAGVQFVRSAEGIDEYRLDNGMRVLFLPDGSKASTSVVVTYLVGSRHEGYGETGMAHLLEHMMFKGTARTPNVPAELTSRGMEYNASTSYDRTNYFESFDPDPEHLKFALELEADRMVNSLVAKKDLDSEMTVVRNEYEMGENSPDRVLMQRLMSTAYLFHNYGNPIIGARSDIESVPIERLQAFYRRYYQPDNAVLLVTGRFDPAQAIGWVAASFGAIPRPERQLVPTYTREPVQDGERTVTVRRTGGTPLTAIAYHVTADGHPDAVAADLLANVLGDTPSGRLHKALVERGLATTAFGSSMTMAEPGLLMFFAVAPKDADLARVRATLIETVEGSVTRPVTKEEFERARTALTSAWESMFNDSRHLAYALSDAIASGDWRLMFLYRDRLKALKIEDVQRVAQAFLRPANRTSGDYLPTNSPDRAEIPEAPPPSEALKGWVGTTGLAAGEAFDPSPPAIEARLRRITLDNGVLVTLLPKRTRGQTVDVAITINYGDERSLANRGAAPDLTARILMRGTTRHSRAAIDRRLDELKARMGVARSGPQSADLVLSTQRDQLASALALAVEVLREPAFPESELELLRREALTRLEQSQSQPEQQAMRAMQRQLSPFAAGHARYVRTFDEQRAALAAVSLGDLKRFHADFYGGSHASIAVVGDFDASAVEADLRRLLGNWNAPAPYAPIILERLPAERHDARIETPDKANALVLGGLPVNAGQDDPDFPALELFAYMFGGNDMRSRLGDRIRQKDGLSYSAGASLDLPAPSDRVHLLTLYAITAPANAPKVEQAFREELGRAVRDGFSDREVAEARSGYLKESQLQRSEDRSLAGMLADDATLGRTMKWTADFESRVAGLTTEQVNEAVRRRVSPEALSIVTAGDLAKGIQPAK